MLFNHCTYFIIRSTGQFEQSVHLIAINVVFVMTKMEKKKKRIQKKFGSFLMPWQILNEFILH